MAKRLYIFTGKGGVGKTTLAMSMTKYFQSCGIKAKYNAFYQDSQKELWQKIDLPVLDTSINSSAEIYIGKKLNSKTIASWIMKTHFFKSLFQMIPGLGHMILLGHILNELENDPELIIVMDSPASGHALTMFESSSNFKNIFRSGLIVKDIEKMHLLLTQKNFLKTVIVTLPTELAIQEAQDLFNELQTNIPALRVNAEIVINDSYWKYIEDHHILESDLPPFLQGKIDLEKKIIDDHTPLPHIGSSDHQQIINTLAPKMEKFV